MFKACWFSHLQPEKMGNVYIGILEEIEVFHAESANSKDSIIGVELPHPVDKLLRNMSDLSTLTPSQLKRAADLKEQISKLEKELQSILGVSAPVTSSPKSSQRKGKMSAAGRAKIVAAQKARWAKIKGEKKAPFAKQKPKRKLSPAARAKIVAAQKARWAKVKAAAKAKS